MIEALAQAPTLDEVVRTLTLRAGYNTRIVVVAAALLGVASGVIGTFALLRKRALMGDALAHAALPGIAGAFLVATWLGVEGRSQLPLLLGAAVSGVLGVVCVQGIIRHTRLREDAAIGAVLSVFFGVGVLLLSYIQGLRTGNQGGLNHFIYGQTAAMQVHDAWLIGSAGVVAVAVAALMHKEFRVVCFDDRFAAAAGVNVAVVDLVMMSLVVLVTVIGLQAVGLVLIVAMLIIPAGAARFWTERLNVMTPLAAVLGGVSGYLGACASALLPDMPAGAVIVLTAGCVFLLSLLAAPSRGLVARVARRASLRRRIAADHLLRALYELLERAGGVAPEHPVPLRHLAATRGWGGLWLRLMVRLLVWRGLVRPAGAGLALTPRGLVESRRITRNHRLWEEFLVTHAELAPSHVDRAADLVEHALSPEMVAELEAALRLRGELPESSIHPIAPP